MKKLIMMGICIILLSITVSGLEQGYPFVGRFMGADTVKLVFENCESKDINLENGELVFTINDLLDIIYADGKTCIGDIKTEDKFTIKLLGCEKNYGDFSIGDSATYLGTHTIEGCEVELGTEYKPVSSGGSSSNDRVVVVQPEELEEILKAKEEKEVIEEPIVDKPETKEKPLIQPEEREPGIDPIVIGLLVLVISSMLWLFNRIYNLKK